MRQLPDGGDWVLVVARGEGVDQWRMRYAISKYVSVSSANTLPPGLGFNS